jgi:hypothetical protein
MADDEVGAIAKTDAPAKVLKVASAMNAALAQAVGVEEAARRLTEKVEILRHFSFGHITKAGPRREIARYFGILASSLIVLCPNNEQRGVALQRLLEARDAALRSAL